MSNTSAQNPERHLGVVGVFPARSHDGIAVSRQRVIRTVQPVMTDTQYSDRADRSRHTGPLLRPPVRTMHKRGHDSESLTNPAAEPEEECHHRMFVADPDNIENQSYLRCEFLHRTRQPPYLITIPGFVEKLHRPASSRHGPPRSPKRSWSR